MLRFLYVSDLKLAGEDVWGQLVVPLVYLDLTLPFGSGRTFSLADMTATPVSPGTLTATASCVTG